MTLDFVRQEESEACLLLTYIYIELSYAFGFAISVFDIGFGANA